MRTKRLLLAVLLSAAATLASGLVAAPAEARPVAGSGSGGDPYFPRQGNGGYRVGHYDLAIRYAPKTHHLHGVARIRAHTLGQRLRRFDLDLRRRLHVRSVLVNGEAASFTQPKRLVQELVITPKHALRANHRFTVRVEYAGYPHSISDPDGSTDGWIRTDDGAFVASEPQGSPTWFPVNDIPRDKATYSVTITVPKALAGISNGAFLGKTVSGGLATYRWRLGKPVSSYLVTATIGKFDITRGRTPRGVPYLIAVDPTVKAAATPVLKKLPAIVDYFTRKFGRYPFGQTGAIVDNAPFVGYALETATRPLFDRAPDELTLAHELAHQWFGDEVTVRYWRDIWINEGFAEWSSWYWDGHRGGATPGTHLDQLLARPASDKATWLPPPAHPVNGAGIFSGSIYDRGAGALQALREKVGKAMSIKILRTWLRAHAYGTATVAQFRAHAQQVAHVDLRHLFFEWLDKKGKPKRT